MGVSLTRPSWPVVVQLKRTRGELERAIEENQQMKKMLSIVTTEYNSLHQHLLSVVNQQQLEIKAAAAQAATAVAAATTAGPSEIVLLGQRASPQRSFPAGSSHSGSHRSRSPTPPDSESVRISQAPAASKVKSESGKVPMEITQVSLELGKTPRPNAGGQRPYHQEAKSQSSERESAAMETHESASHEETAVSEPQEQPQGWPPNKRMKSVLQDTSVRNARVSVRTRTDAPTVRLPTTCSASSFVNSI